MNRFICFILIAALLALPHLSIASDLKLDEKSCGSRQKLTVGDALEISLPGNPTTGYVWQAPAVPVLLQQQGEPLQQSNSKLVGAGGVTSFRFNVVSVGEANLELLYRRSWEKEIPPARTCRIQLVSSAAKKIQPAGKMIGKDKQGDAIYQIQGNGIGIGYKLVGSGEPLVMIMGLGDTMDHWQPGIISALSKSYQLIIMDNRGMGYSTTNDTTFSYQLFADDVIALLDALKVKKTNVLGYSMGSTITQKLLLQYPQRFNKAVIHATTADGSNVAKLLKNSTVTNVPPTVLRQLEATTHWKTPLEKLRNIQNQVLLIVGTADTTVGDESSKTIASAIPGAWLVQFKNATHQLMYEAPDEFSRIVLLFLAIDAQLVLK